jgi:hypothetical protein
VPVVVKSTLMVDPSATVGVAVLTPTVAAGAAVAGADAPTVSSATMTEAVATIAATMPVRLRFNVRNIVMPSLRLSRLGRRTAGSSRCRCPR